jgi:membrane protein DedA with SNARE-associated domain
LPKWLRQGEGGVQSTKLFERWGVWSIFLTRFLLTPIALPVNLLAGSTRFSWRKYMTAVITGELIWVALFGGLGRVFADQWEMVSQLAGDITGILLGGLLTVGGLTAVVMRNQRLKKGAPSNRP